MSWSGGWPVLFLAASLGGFSLWACDPSDDPDFVDPIIGQPGSADAGGIPSAQPGAGGDAMVRPAGDGSMGTSVDGRASDAATGSTQQPADATTSTPEAATGVRDANAAVDAAPVTDAARTPDAAPAGNDAGTNRPDASLDAGTDAGSTGPCTAAPKMSCANESGSHCGYTFEYWKDQGSGCLTNTADGFSVQWSNINNLLGRKGLRPGSKNQVVTFDANYQPNGNSYLTIYGWTKDPLVEYYIVDSWGSWRPPGGEGHMGTVTSDGGTYDIYRTQRVNQPSIDGTKTFYQYWSVRTQKRTNGTVTVANHFEAWAKLGMNMGALYEVSMCVEGYQSSGMADVRFSMR